MRDVKPSNSPTQSPHPSPSAPSTVVTVRVSSGGEVSSDDIKPVPDTKSASSDCNNLRAACCFVSCCFWAPIQKIITACDTVQNCYQLNASRPYRYEFLMQKDFEWWYQKERAAAGEVAICAPLSSIGSICAASCGCCMCCSVPKMNMVR